MAQSDNSKWK